MNSKTLYVTGQIIAPTKSGIVWAIIGIYDTEELSAANCVTDNCFVGPVELNNTYPDEINYWDGLYFPYDGKYERGLK